MNEQTKLNWMSLFAPGFFCMHTLFSLRPLRLCGEILSLVLSSKNPRRKPERQGSCSLATSIESGAVSHFKAWARCAGPAALIFSCVHVVVGGRLVPVRVSLATTEAGGQMPAAGIPVNVTKRWEVPAAGIETATIRLRAEHATADKNQRKRQCNY